MMDGNRTPYVVHKVAHTAKGENEKVNLAHQPFLPRLVVGREILS